MYSIKGFTLVELMVSLTLGLIIMLSAMQLLLTNQISFNLQSGMGNVQENGRFALDYINNSVRSAEYSQNTSNPTVGIITIQSELPGLPNNTLVTRNDLTSLGKGMSDQLVTRMWVSPTMIASNFRDCEGNAVAAQGFVVTRYFVRTDPVTGSNAALACDSGYYAVGAATVSNYGDDGVVLLSTIDSFQIQLGVSAFPIPPLGQRVPIRYLTAQAYTNIVAASRPIVVSLRMALLVRSNEKVSTGFSATIPDVRVLEKTIVGSDLNDKFVHRVFNSTLALRNAM
jgi:type IV pilus assembly protein PilW